MRVKKFEAKTMKDALQMVKKELGPDAVILAARDNRKSFGLGGEASVEVTAAVSESTLQKKRAVESRLTTSARDKFLESDARTQRAIIEKMVERRKERDQEKPKRPITTRSYIDIQDEEAEPAPRRAAYNRATGRNVADLLHAFDRDFDDDANEDDKWQTRTTREAAKVAAPLRSEQTQNANGANGSRFNRAVEQIRQHLQPSQNPQALQSAQEHLPQVQQAEPVRAQSPVLNANGDVEPSPQQNEIASLKGEIDRLQTHLEKMMQGFHKVPQNFVSMHPGAEYGIPYDLSFMFQKLVETGVTVDHTIDILQAAARELDPVQMKKRPLVDAWVARWILSHVSTSASPFQGRLHLFVGGAGSGKTSSLVKMASHFVVKERKKVAILTTDSFKVGAVDQLKIYCQILNVPFAILRSRKDWEWVLGQLQNVDHILVDFPGLQLRDLDEIHLLKSLLPPGELAPITHYCVAATTKDGDAYEMAKRYKVADFADLIFTNLDQSVQHGIIYNLHQKTGRPLHSFGVGNKIPEDFEAASKERVLDLMFKLTRLKRETK